MDNPVEVDFTPAGEIVGVVNIHYNQPRADTLVHWIYGGVYQRPDQLGAIAGLPRTIKDMPFAPKSAGPGCDCPEGSPRRPRTGRSRTITR
jgi:hypothetical protein